MESELFSFERGAFTGAQHAKPGLFQVAHTGTIFLDEVGLLSEPLQAKLLKVVEDRVVRRLGGTRAELWHRLLRVPGGAVSENGRLRQGTGRACTRRRRW